MMENFRDLHAWFKDQEASIERVGSDFSDLEPADIDLNVKTDIFDLTNIKDVKKIHTEAQAGINEDDMFIVDVGDKKVIVAVYRDDKYETTGRYTLSDAVNEHFACNYINQHPTISDKIDAPDSSLVLTNNILIQQHRGEDELSRYGLIENLTYENIVEIDAIDWIVGNTDLHSHNLRVGERNGQIKVFFIDMDFAFDDGTYPDHHFRDSRMSRRYSQMTSTLDELLSSCSKQMLPKPRTYIQDVYEKYVELVEDFDIDEADLRIHPRDHPNYEKAMDKASKNKDIFGSDNLPSLPVFMSQYFDGRSWVREIEDNRANRNPNKTPIRTLFDIDSDLQNIREAYNNEKQGIDNPRKHFSYVENAYDFVLSISRSTDNIDMNAYKTTDEIGVLEGTPSDTNINLPVKNWNDLTKDQKHRLETVLKESTLRMPLSVEKGHRGEFYFILTEPWHSEEWLKYLNVTYFIGGLEPTVEAYNAEDVDDLEPVYELFDIITNEISRNDVPDSYYDPSIETNWHYEHLQVRFEPPHQWEGGERYIAEFLADKLEEQIEHLIDEYDSTPLFHVDSGFDVGGKINFNLELNEDVFEKTSEDG